jgi:hypothetical protein
MRALRVIVLYINLNSRVGATLMSSWLSRTHQTLLDLSVGMLRSKADATSTKTAKTRIAAL